MRLQDYDIENHYTAKVVATERITSEESEDEIRELELEVDRADFSYEIGQSIGIIVPGPHEFGQGAHFRLYSICDIPERSPDGRPRVKICVKRCTYIDGYSGERHPGVASNYLCDLRPGAAITFSGPYGLAFEIPEDRSSNLLLIVTGTGIAPFRAFIKHLYQNVGGWKGKVWLFYGARTGLELLYMNDKKSDLANYFDQDTFEAFEALSPRPNWADPIAWDYALEERSEEIWEMLEDPKTYVYLAGLEEIRDALDDVLTRIAGSKEKWERRKAELIAGKRWVELLY